MVWHPDMDVRCGVRTARLTAWCTVLYEESDVRTVNGFVLPRDRGLEYASLKYRRRNSVIIIASLLEYKRALLYILPPLTTTGETSVLLSVVLTAFGLSGPHHSADNKIDNYHYYLSLGIIS